MAVGNRIYEKAYCSLKPENRGLLRGNAQKIRETGNFSVTPTGPKLKPEVCLARTWDGQTYIVALLDKGFLYCDQ